MEDTKFTQTEFTQLENGSWTAYNAELSRVMFWAMTRPELEDKMRGLIREIQKIKERKKE